MSKQISDWVLGESGEIVKERCLSAIRHAIDSNPVQTGWSRAHWKIGMSDVVDIPEMAEEYRPDDLSYATEEASSMMADQEVDVLALSLADPVRVSLSGISGYNDVPYVGDLEDRTGFVTEAFDKL